MTNTAEDTAPAGDGRPPRGPHRRWLTAVIVALLIALPSGYLVGSAQASRESGRDKQRLAAAEGLIHEWPSKVLRRVYQVPLPKNSRNVAYHEINTWDHSSLLMQFTIGQPGLQWFLRSIDRDRESLRPGEVTISDRHARKVGWKFDDPGRRFAGTVHRTPGSKPDHAVTVDLSDPEAPRVYVVSTVHF